MDKKSPNNRIRDARRQDKELQSRSENPTTELTSNNIIDAKNFIFKQTTRQLQPRVQRIDTNKPINTTSRVRHLSPFLDEDGFLQARGRLEKSQLEYCIKHPITLDGNHRSSPLHTTNTTKTTSIRHSSTQEIFYKTNTVFEHRYND